MQIIYVFNLYFNKDAIRTSDNAWVKCYGHHSNELEIRGKQLLSNLITILFRHFRCGTNKKRGIFIQCSLCVGRDSNL
jgi:hypothetical protein